MRPARVSALAALFLIAGCATPEARVRASLVHVGLSAELSRCMAKDMARRLSFRQLSRLRDLAHVGDRIPQKTSVERYLHQVRALGDGEIWTVTAGAAGRCALDW